MLLQITLKKLEASTNKDNDHKEILNKLFKERFDKTIEWTYEINQMT